MKRRNVNKNLAKSLAKDKRYLLVEGETEKEYIKKVKQLFHSKLYIKFKCKPNFTHKPNALNKTIEEFEQEGYSRDEIFFIYDIENNNTNENRYGIFLYNDHTLKFNHVYLSNPCLEYFILLHYKEFKKKKIHNQKEALERVKKICPTYEKGNAKNFSNFTQEQVMQAIHLANINFTDYAITKNYSTVGQLLQYLFGI